jgi:hypothetical protein
MRKKIRREVLASRRKVTECHECFKSEARASSAQDQTPSINPGQEMRNSSWVFRLGHIATCQLALRTSVSSTSVTVIRPGAGCSITSAATVSTTGATGGFTFRATFFTGARLSLALATVRFTALAALRALLRLAESLFTFSHDLPPVLSGASKSALTQHGQVPATTQSSYQQIVL